MEDKPTGRAQYALSPAFAKAAGLVKVPADVRIRVMALWNVLQFATPKQISLLSFHASPKALSRFVRISHFGGFA
jgi:hypothetical protein